PSNYMQLQQQSSSIKALLRMRSASSQSPLNTVINQILKACQIGMQSAAIFEEGVSESRAFNVKKSQKRTWSKIKILHKGGILVQEAAEIIEALNEGPIAPAPPGQDGLHHFYSR